MKNYHRFLLACLASTLFGGGSALATKPHCQTLISNRGIGRLSKDQIPQPGIKNSITVQHIKQWPP